MSRPIDPARDLLVGLLALQNGLINQVQLVAAFQTWTLDKARPLADHLISFGHLNDAQRAVVEALADMHVAKHGDVEGSFAAIPADRSTHESLAQLGDRDIEGTLARVQSRSSHRDGQSDTDRTATYSVGSSTSDGLRFRVLRPHARGGLGAVFVALDTELHREVALKQILDQHADDPISRQRFLLEAEVNGGLEHPGIVPVYGLGTYGDGRPYYAMRFIRGDSLKEAIEQFHADAASKTDAGRRSLELRKLLRRFLDVCNAIEYAHSRGVLHRDIKPGNIIVGKHGETLVVDWGLAKARGAAALDDSEERPLLPTSGSGSMETLPGSALGTPAYMSPEQAGGDLDRLGPRSDVYSLGATLYCLLTGRLPFDGDDVGEVLRKVKKGEFANPRQLRPEIDSALEAVCKKAMALKPGDRYSSCRALADDVERWMADEPVTAWSEPWTRTLLRWLTRHRVGVTAAAAAGLVALVGLTGVAAVQAQGRAMLEVKNRQLADANAKVRARYDLAVDAIKTFHTGVSEDFLLKQDQFKELRDRLLNSASDFYGKLGALLGKETDVVSRRALAQSNYELADLTYQVGRIQAALMAHRAVLAAREALAAETGVAPGVKADVGRSLTAVASLLYWTGKVDEALTTYRRSESLLAGVAASDPEARAALAACRTRMSRPLLHAGKPAEALAACKLARADREAPAALPGASKKSRAGFADTVNELGIVLWQSGKPAEAEPEFRTALSILQKLVDENPADILYRNFSGTIRLSLGNVLKLTGKASEAEAEIRMALAIYQTLSDENPGFAIIRRNSALGHNDLGDLLSETAKLSEAEAEYRTARAIEQKLADENSANTDVRSLLSSSHRSLGRLLPLAGKLSEAEAECRTALAIDQTLAGDDPTKTFFRSCVARSHSGLGSVLLLAGKLSEAEAECRMALAINQKLTDENPDDTEFPVEVARALVYLGDVVRLLGRPAEAKSGYERAIALLEPAVQQNPMDASQRCLLACSIRRRGLTLSDLGDPAGAAAEARRALGFCDRLGLRSVSELFESACCHAALFGLAAATGSGVSPGQGRTEANRAMDQLRHAVALGFRNRDAFQIEAVLGPLRGREEYRLMMMDLAMPDEPFSEETHAGR
jgi:serine/threonine-protein kinase